MNRNEGPLDRTLRVLLGLALLSLILVLDGAHRYWGLVGVVPLLTGLVGYCPLYAAVGLSTCPLSRR